jgi:hypothetical protein
MRPRRYESVTKCMRFFSPSLVYCALRYKNQTIPLQHCQKSTMLYSCTAILFPVTDLWTDIKSRRRHSLNCKTYNTTANGVLRDAVHRQCQAFFMFLRKFTRNFIFPAPIIAILTNVQQHNVQTTYTELHTKQEINVESKTGTSVMPLNQAWFSLHRLSQNSRSLDIFCRHLP